MSMRIAAAVLLLTIATVATADEAIVPLARGEKGGIAIKAGVTPDRTSASVSSVGVAVKYQGTTGAVTVNQDGSVSISGERSFEIDNASVHSWIRAGHDDLAIGMRLKFQF